MDLSSPQPTPIELANRLGTYLARQHGNREQALIALFYGMEYPVPRTLRTDLDPQNLAIEVVSLCQRRGILPLLATSLQKITGDAPSLNDATFVDYRERKNLTNDSSIHALAQHDTPADRARLIQLFDRNSDRFEQAHYWVFLHPVEEDYLYEPKYYVYAATLHNLVEDGRLELFLELLTECDPSRMNVESERRSPESPYSVPTAGIANLPPDSIKRVLSQNLDLAGISYLTVIMTGEMPKPYQGVRDATDSLVDGCIEDRTTILLIQYAAKLNDAIPNRLSEVTIGEVSQHSPTPTARERQLPEILLEREDKAELNTIEVKALLSLFARILPASDGDRTVTLKRMIESCETTIPEDERRQLVRAIYEGIIPRIDVSGSPDTSSTSIYFGFRQAGSFQSGKTYLAHLVRAMHQATQERIDTDPNFVVPEGYEKALRAFFVIQDGTTPHPHSSEESTINPVQVYRDEGASSSRAIILRGRDYDDVLAVLTNTLPYDGYGRRVMLEMMLRDLPGSREVLSKIRLEGSQNAAATATISFLQTDAYGREGEVVPGIMRTLIKGLIAEILDYQTRARLESIISR